jgi:hypothetical protein
VLDIRQFAQDVVQYCEGPELLRAMYKAISSVSILSGFAENQEAYLRNNRVRRLRLTFGDGSTQVVTFEDKMEMQRFELKQAATTEWITFEILTVFHGSKTKLTPISEILFNREP